ASGLGMKSLTKKERAKFDGRKDMTEGQKAAAAEGMARTRAAELIKAGETAAEATGSDDVLTKLDEFKKKNPALADSPKGIMGSVRASSDASKDVKAFLSSQNTDSFKDSLSLAAILSTAGAMDKNGNEVDSEAARHLRSKGGERVALMDEFYRNTSPEERAAMLKGMAPDAKDEDVKRAEELRGSISRDKDSRQLGYVKLSAATAPQVDVKQTFQVRNEQAIDAGKDRLATYASQGLGDRDTKVMNERVALAGAGASLAEAFNFDAKGGTFGNEDQRQSFTFALKDTSASLAKGDERALEWVSRLDTASMLENRGGLNEARQAAVKAFSVEDLKKAVGHASQPGNEAAQAKLKDVLEGIRVEAQQALKRAKAANIYTSDMNLVAAKPTSNEAKTVIRRMETAGFVDPQASASAVAKHNEIRLDNELRNMVPSVSRRAVGAVGRTAAKAGSAVKGSASAAASSVGEAASQAGSAYTRRKEEKTQAKLDKKVGKMMDTGEDT
ncbi:hypothetical protein L0Y59_03320, partial [Candidatus Uhrbacteria bacterium]|nr:hypothetical protein [Candidatus Uhrbacteria bacterium]